MGTRRCQSKRTRTIGRWPPPVQCCTFCTGGLNRSAVGKTQVSFTSRRPQQLAPSTLTSLLACTNALRRAILRHGYAWRQPRFNSSLCGRPALFPERAPCPSIQSTLKQKLCPSRLRPPRLHPQGRRGLSSGRARLRPCGYNILQRRSECAALRRNRRQARASSSAPASTRSGVVNPSV